MSDQMVRQQILVEQQAIILKYQMRLEGYKSCNQINERSVYTKFDFDNLRKQFEDDFMRVEENVLKKGMKKLNNLLKYYNIDDEEN